MGFLDNAHTCPRCRRIQLDGTGPHVEQRFEFSYSDIRASAAVCLLFRWCLLQARVVPEPTDRLVLYVSEDSEDITYLNVLWKDESGQTLSTDYFCDSTSLHIFAEKGTLCSFRWLILC
jgi:hypothetical protein